MHCILLSLKFLDVHGFWKSLIMKKAFFFQQDIVISIFYSRHSYKCSFSINCCFCSSLIDNNVRTKREFLKLSLSLIYSCLLLKIYSYLWSNFTYFRKIWWWFVQNILPWWMEICQSKVRSFSVQPSVCLYLVSVSWILFD